MKNIVKFWEFHGNKEKPKHLPTSSPLPPSPLSRKNPKEAN
jgi:hypothetical protein